MDKQLKKDIDKWERKTGVYVTFMPIQPKAVPAVELEGTFYADELRKIASILKKIEKQKQPVATEENQTGFFCPKCGTVYTKIDGVLRYCSCNPKGVSNGKR